jgi:hypothetical protein
VLAGLTVYAVPQVLAATLPIGALSNQVGTIVKLVRVLMLGPVVLGLSLLARNLRTDSTGVRTNKRMLSKNKRTSGASKWRGGIRRTLLRPTRRLATIDHPATSLGLQRAIATRLSCRDR